MVLPRRKPWGLPKSVQGAQKKNTMFGVIFKIKYKNK